MQPLLIRSFIRFFAIVMTASVSVFGHAHASDFEIKEPLKQDNVMIEQIGTEHKTNGPNDDDIQQDVQHLGYVLPAMAEVEIQHQFNELRDKLLDDRAETITWWLGVIAIVLAFFGVFVAIAGFLGFARFREIEAEAKASVGAATKHAEDAKRYVDEIEQNRKKADEILHGMNAETAAKNPEKVKRMVQEVRENPVASLLDKAVADAITLHRQGKKDKSIEKWQAIANLAEENDPNLAARAWFSVGFLVAEKDPERCIYANDQAIRLNPDFAEAYGNRGTAKRVLSRYKESILDYNKMISLKPDDFVAYSSRGDAWAALGRYQFAITDHDKAISLMPTSSSAYNSRGIVKDMYGHHEAAIDDYDEAIRLEPDNAEFYSNRGIAKSALGRHDDAIADHDKAIHLKSDFAAFYDNRANAKYAADQYEEAIIDYNKAIELNPNFAQTFSNRGNAKFALAQHDDAIADQQEAIRLEPDCAVAYNNLGEVKAALGQHGAAISDYDEAIRIEPNLAEAYSNRGEAKAELGHKDEARHDLETALQCARAVNNTKIIKRAEQLLDELGISGNTH